MDKYIGFTGHRNCVPENNYFLEILYNSYPDAIWVHGGARGFDTYIHEFMKGKGRPCKIIIPDYDKYKDRPKYAPIARNFEIVDMCFIMIAGYDHIRKVGGTYRTIEYCKKQNKILFYIPIKLI